MSSESINKIFDKNDQKAPKKDKKVLIEELKKSIFNINDKNWHRHIPARFSALTTYSIKEIKQFVKEDKEIEILWDALKKKYNFQKSAAILKKTYSDHIFDSENEDFEFGNSQIIDSKNFEEENIDFNSFETEGDFTDETAEFEKN